MAESRRMHRLEGGVVRFSMRKSLHWPTGAEVRHKPMCRGGAMLYDASRAGNADIGWFDRDWWARRGDVRRQRRRAAARRCSSMPTAVGWCCATTGAAAGWHACRLDRYLWREADATRSFIEWHLLYLMHRAGLPVPVPIAACYRRNGRHSYTADLLTEQITGVSSLALRAGGRAAAADGLDRDRPLPAPLSRRRRLPRRSECAQRAAG